MISFFWRSIVGCIAILVTAGSTTPLAAVEARLVNLSSRGVVGTGANVLIAGFVIGGGSPKDVLVRAVGPALASAGVKGALSHARLQVFDSQSQVVSANEQWSSALSPAFAEVGASPLPAGSKDAALRLTLKPGNYSVQVSGVDAPTGVALVEVYEMGQTSKLLNLSTRARVESGDGILISGLVITGTEPRRVLVRASGPALTRVGVTGVLANPVLSLFNSSGVIAMNDDWSTSDYAAEISTASAAAGAVGFDPGSRDSALLIDLQPGIYSMQVKGVADAAGVALLEVFDVSATSAGPTGEGAPVGTVNSAAKKDGSGVTAGGSTEDSIPSGPTYGSGLYTAESLSWSSAAVSARLGPTFAQLNPGAVDDRPTHFKPQSKNAGSSYYIRINPYELGEPGSDSDYWSDTGQVGYVPDDPVNDPGLDRIQTFAYYNRAFAISPRPDYPSGKQHSDPQTRESNYAEMNGSAPRQPVAMVRGYGMQQNEQVMVYRDGLFAVAGMQTSRAGSERPYPGFKFPSNKVPRAIAVTTSNEFALVTIWDTDRHQGQLAVVALEGKFLPFHTWPYMGLPNQGSFSSFKLLGYVDLPMASPNAVAAASNGLWRGPSSTDGRVLSQIDLADDGKRKLIYDGDWQFVVAKNGYAIVSSTEENKAVIVDLTPLFTYMRESYLSSSTSFAQTVAARGGSPQEFPQTFDVNPAIKPKVIWQSTLAQPTAVLAGQELDRWSKDRFKAYVASRNGTVHIIDASPLMVRNSWEIRGELKEIGTVQVGRNPVSMAFARHGDSNLPLIPNDSTGAQRSPDSTNNLFYVACRGERSIDTVVTWQGQGQMYRRIKDSRMGDPVAVSVAVRGNIVTVADYAGKKLLNFRIGNIYDSRNKKNYPVGDPAYDFEFGGEMPLLGSPFLVNTANLN
jgi:hypothetical protein